MHPIKHDFWSPVPTRGHVTSHFVLRGSSQAKVEDFQFTIFIDGNVGGLQVLVAKGEVFTPDINNETDTDRETMTRHSTHPVDDASRVDVFHASEDLIDQKLDVVVGQSLSLDNVVQVGPHQVGDQVHVDKLVQGFAGRKDIQQANDVFMVHVLEHSQLSVRPLGVDGRLEGPGQLLDGHFQAGSVSELRHGVGGTADLQHSVSGDSSQCTNTHHSPDHTPPSRRGISFGTAPAPPRSPC